MRLSSKSRTVDKVGVLEEIKYHIEDAGDIITQLVAGQYSDPIGAFVRELGTNAYEAHQEAGKETVPFVVTVPDPSNGNYVIRDYGPGLSLDQVKQLYTSVGGSTKRNSNQMGGCFGLGSKSPLAYTDSFSVNSYYNGRRYSYLVYKDESDYPHFDLVDEQYTEEPSGLEITVPIREKDYSTVRQTCCDIYRHFLTIPKLQYHNETNIVIAKPDIALTIKNFSILSVKNPYLKSYYPSVKMGNIVYPIDVTQPDLQPFNRWNVIITLPIGSIDVSTSREQLKYTLKTRTCLVLALNLCKRTWIEYCNEQVANKDSLFSASIEAHSLCGQFPIINVTELMYKGTKLLPIRVNTNKLGTIYYNDNGILREAKSWNQSVELTDRPIIVLNDSPADYKVRIKQEMQRRYAKKCLVISNDTLNQVVSLFQLSDSDVIKASKIEYTRPKYERTKKESGYNILEFIADRKNTSSWRLLKQEEVPTTQQYYVSLKNFSASMNGTPITYSALDAIKRISGIKIYGVRASGKPLDSWISLHEFVQSDKFKQRVNDVNNLLSDWTKICASRTFLNNLSVLKSIPSDLNTFYKEYKNFKQSLIECSIQDVELVSRLFNIKLSPSLGPLINELQTLSIKYKLLSHFPLHLQTPDVQSEFVSHYLMRKN